MLNLDSIDISDVLRESLREWAREHDTQQLPDKVWSSRQEWVDRGLDLARDLAQELGPDISVLFAEGDREVRVR